MKYCWNEIYFGVRKPHISKWPHVIFEPTKKHFDVVSQVMGNTLGIWGLPIPYDKNGNPTVEGADRWGVLVKCEEDIKKLKDSGRFIPIYCDENGSPICFDGEESLPINAWTYEKNQQSLLVIWNQLNEIDKVILNCNHYNSDLDPLIETFFEVKEDITSNIDQLLEELGWFMFPVGSDEEFSALVASNKNRDLISHIIEGMESNHLKYRII